MFIDVMADKSKKSKKKYYENSREPFRFSQVYFILLVRCKKTSQKRKQKIEVKRKEIKLLFD